MVSGRSREGDEFSSERIRQGLGDERDDGGCVGLCFFVFLRKFLARGDP